jgi:hypothetical protein
MADFQKDCCCWADCLCRATKRRCQRQVPLNRGAGLCRRTTRKRQRRSLQVCFYRLSALIPFQKVLD